MIAFYNELIDRAILNISMSKQLFNFFIPLSSSSLNDMYNLSEFSLNESEHIERYEETLSAFLLYHNFLGINVNVLKSRKDFLLHVVNTMSI